MIKESVQSELSKYENLIIKMLHENKKFHILQTRIKSENLFLDEEIPKVANKISEVSSI